MNVFKTYLVRIACMHCVSLVPMFPKPKTERFLLLFIFWLIVVVVVIRWRQRVKPCVRWWAEASEL